MKQMTTEQVEEVMSRHCPDCACNWWLFPPARIQTGAGKETDQVRCIECKRVYHEPIPHTPGPWTARTNSFGTQFIYGPDSTKKISPMGVEYNALICGGDHPGTLTEANARLIAVAPEMLAELQWVRKGLEQLRRMPGLRSSSEELIKRVDAVIGKATGDTVRTNLGECPGCGADLRMATHAFGCEAH